MLGYREYVDLEGDVRGPGRGCGIFGHKIRNTSFRLLIEEQMTIWMYQCIRSDAFCDVFCTSKTAIYVQGTLTDCDKRELSRKVIPSGENAQHYNTADRRPMSICRGPLFTSTAVDAVSLRPLDQYATIMCTTTVPHSSQKNGISMGQCTRLKQVD